MLADPMITMAYVEHQMDTIAKLVIDLAESQEITDPKVLERLSLLKQIMTHSSIDFDDLTNQFQNYKIPKTIEHKENTRKVSNRYLLAQLREGIL